MITRWDLITKKTGMPEAAFRNHWEQVNAPLAMQSRTMHRFVQNFVTDSQQRGVAFPRVEVTADAFAELWFDNLNTMKTFEGAFGQKLAEDYSTFASNVTSLITVKNIVIPIADKPLLKRMSFIKRLPGISPEQYKHEWWDVHGDFVRQFKGVRGYCQSLILDRVINGQSVPYEEVPFDGIVELYFDDLEGLNGDFASEVGKTAQVHGHTFLEAVSTYLVEPTLVRP